jgi:hypothetical protein
MTTDSAAFDAATGFEGVFNSNFLSLGSPIGRPNKDAKELLSIFPDAPGFEPGSSLVPSSGKI